MTALERAIADIVATLESLHVNYALIGGIANAVWGEPRATVDVDVTISVDDQQIPDTIDALARRFRIAVQDPLRFVRDTRVLPLDAANGVRVDVIFGLLSMELDAIRRARTVQLAGASVRVVTPEDLILMKVISDRPRDIADAEAVARRQAHNLDLDYLEPRIKELATSLEREDIFKRWRSWAVGRRP
jgi:hypothetical protein